MDENILLLTVEALNRTRTGRGGLTNEQANLLGASAGAGIKGRNGLESIDPAPGLFLRLTECHLSIGFPRLDNPRNELKHPGAVLIANGADPKLLDEHHLV